MRTLEPRAGNSVALGEGRMLLNPGSVGQPRDGDPRASYLVLDLDGRDRDLGPRRLRHRGRRQRRCARPGCPSGWPTASASAPDRRVVIGGRRPLQGRKPGDRRVRVERPHAPYFRYTGAGQLTAKEAASAPTTRDGQDVRLASVASSSGARWRARRSSASA